jgi:hypothetical protein
VLHGAVHDLAELGAGDVCIDAVVHGLLRINQSIDALIITDLARAVESGHGLDGLAHGALPYF